jgi:thioredoxin-related protein
VYNEVNLIFGDILKRLLLLIFLLTISLFAETPIKRDKMILLYVEMDYCPWCQRMDKEVFENSKNFDYLQKLYTIKRVKRGGTPAFVKAKYYPTTFILSSDGKEIVDELPGYMKAEDYLDYLNTLVEVENSTE